MLREHSLDDAIQCIQSGHVSADNTGNNRLDDGEYIWRARDDKSQGDVTLWNLSWVDSNSDTGWVELELSGTPSSENCTKLDSDSSDESIAYSRSDIPSVLSIKMMEEDLTDQMRYPVLSGPNGLFTSTGEYHTETRVGILVVTPDSDFTEWLSALDSGEAGATTLDITRTWSSIENGIEWENTLSLAMDARTGQVVGWNLAQSPS